MVDPDRRLVIRLPLAELWNPTADLGSARCLGTIGREELIELLRQGPVRFVVVDVGLRPLWLELNDCYTFWKNEVKPHLARNTEKIMLADYPDEYAYVAKQWATSFSEPVIVLEKYH